MGFASGFQVGWNAVREAERDRKQRELEEQFAKVGRDKQYAAYSPAQGAQMTAESEERNPDGSLRYRFEIDPGSTKYRRIENEYNPQDYRTDEYTPALGYSYGGGLGPQSPAAQAFSVPRPDLTTRTVYDRRMDPQYQAERDMEGGEVSVPGKTAPMGETGPIPYGGTPVPMGTPPGRGDTDLPLSREINYTPTLQGNDPRDTAAYRGLTGRAPGGDATYAPDREMFMGKSYAPGQLNEDMKMAARQEEYAKVLERAGRPQEAMQMRVAAQAARKNTLEMQNLEATAEKQKNLRGVQSNLASWMKARVGDRQPTSDDFDAFETKTISDLMAGGHVDEANAAYDRRNRVVMERMKMEEAARGQSINKAVFALSSGDLQPAVNLYNQFVHDGAKVTGIERNPKDGTVVVKRQASDGVDLPDYKFGSLDELSASLRSLTDPGAFAAYTQNSFMNNIRTKTLELDARKTASEEKRANAYEKRSGAAEARAERADVVYLTDGKQVFEYKRGQLQYDKSGRLQLPEGMSIYKGQGQVSQGNLTKEQETALRAIEGSEAFKSAYDTVNDPNTPAAEKRAAAARIEQMLKQRGLPPDLYKFEQYEHQPMP